MQGTVRLISDNDYEDRKKSKRAYKDATLLFCLINVTSRVVHDLSFSPHILCFNYQSVMFSW